MKNIFDKNEVETYISRINQLSPEAKPTWGKMSVAQMLAHCNVTYELVYDNKHPKPGAFTKLIMKLFVKNIVVSEKPYKQSSQTAPEFIIKDERNFEPERQRLIEHIQKTQALGKTHFEGKASHAFGALSSVEWNNLFTKHLEHHLTQFGV